MSGTGAANPIATILSAAMMLRFSFQLPAEADAIERAVDKALDDGLRTADIAGGQGREHISTEEMTDGIIERL